MPYRLCVFAATVSLFCSGASEGRAGDWLQWRGPGGNGVADAGQVVPTEWDENRNVIWKTEIPGRGHSSPTVVGDLIVLTSADEASQSQAVLAFDRNTGKQKWLTVISQGGFPKIHEKNTHASPTVASDGKLFFATFHHHNQIEAVALDTSGKIVWKTIAGAFKPELYEYGYAASPTIYDGTVIITGNCDTSSWMKALKPETGDVVWQQELPRMLVWSSPIVARVAGRDQLLLSGFEHMSAFDPTNGEKLWSVPCLTIATCGTAVWDDNMVYASGGYPKAETVGVKAEGAGQLVWKNNVKCYEQSMLIHNGYIYAFSDNGTVYCWEAKTGKEMWKTRLRGPVSASPVLVGDLILAANELGTTYVFKASPDRFERIAQNQIGNESFATPTVVDNRIYIRAAVRDGNGRKEGLFCIGAEKQ
ncbi:MAG: PQQ-binding-like beta-propeller repeat protein [Planctomycetaceae bacterium]|nr:PQQ-binding-like beta-propeller repeat protein [Planctomycetaceae bacterium]